MSAAAEQHTPGTYMTKRQEPNDSLSQGHRLSGSEHQLMSTSRYVLPLFLIFSIVYPAATTSAL